MFKIGPKMLKIGQKMTKIDPKMLKIRQIDPKISKKCLSYSKNPSHNKKYGTCPKNPTAGPKAYLAQPCAQVPTQFAPMSLAISGYIWPP